jgi:solute carrier family 25 uncoupling protein 27
MLRTMRSIVSKEGFSSLWSGIGPAAARQFPYQGCNVMLFKQFKRSLSPFLDETALSTKLLCGTTSGALGQALVVPLDLVKIKMQTDGRRQQQGKKPYYSGARDIVQRVTQQHGWRGLWRGASATCLRAAISNGTSLASYDYTKQWLIKLNHGRESAATQICAAVCSGIACTLASTPADVIKTRYLRDRKGRYASVLDCLRQTLRSESVLSLWKGTIPACTRLVPYQCVFFICYEQMCLLFSLESF